MSLVTHHLSLSSRLREIFHDEETHFITLTEHFFRRFFNSEFVSIGADQHWTVTNAVAFVAVPGVLYSIWVYWEYAYIYWHFSPAAYQQATMVDEGRFVIFAMAIIGFVTVLEWDALFPDGRDYAALMPLPVKASALFTAKISSLIIFAGLFAAALVLPPALLFPASAISGSPRHYESIPYGARMAAAHIVSVGAGSLFIFLFFVALQGVLISSVSYRIFKRISLCVQVISLVALLLMFSLLSLAPSLLPMWKRTNSPALFLLPPMWFLGLYRTLMGSNDEVFRRLAHVAVAALGLVALISAATYLLTYKIHAQKTWERAGGASHKPNPAKSVAVQLMNRLILRSPLERAAFYFVSMTIFRSARQRLYLATYLGIGTALALLGVGKLFVGSHHGEFVAGLGYPSEALLSIPLILSFFVLSGMRMVFAVPSELGANWIFQITEDAHRKECLSGVRKAMVLLGIVPIFALLFPVYAALWGFALALFETAFGVVLALILVELLLLNFRKVPFTCSYLPGKANVVVLGVLYWLAFTIYAYTMARLEYWMLDDPVRWIAGLVVVFGVLLWLAVYRSRLVARGFDFRYEEEPDPAVQVLNLS